MLALKPLNRTLAGSTCISWPLSGAAEAMVQRSESSYALAETVVHSSPPALIWYPPKTLPALYASSPSVLQDTVLCPHLCCQSKQKLAAYLS